MRTFLLLLWPAWSTLALHFDITARSIKSYKTVVGNVLAAGDSDHSDPVFSTRDVLYIANVTIDGNEYPLQMDTGSSDLWANMGTNQPSNPTELSVNLTYGTGFAYGPVSRGPVTFAGYEIPDQAFLQFKDGANPVFNFGAVGIVGLGFTGLSHIDAAVTSNGNSTWGRSLLYNIFALNPTEPNFIAMALERANDPSDSVQGSLGVGEYSPEYADIASTDHIPLFPPEGSNRWTVLLDSYVVNGATQNLTSTISDVPQGRAAVLVDSGTTYSYVPPDVAKSLYSTVPGATLDTTANQWIVPCSGGIRLTLWFAGRPFDIHPLDTVIPTLGDETKCMGSFIPSQLAVGATEFDWIIGTNVLRSLYVVYDFGDFDQNNVMGNPYIQFLSLVDIYQAASDFQSLRGGTVNVDQGNGNASSSVSVLTTSQKLDKLLDLVPLIFAVIGANALILITLLAIIIWMCCYLRKQNNRKPKNTPLPLTTVTPSHTYEAVPTQDNDRRSPSRNLSRTASKQSHSSRSINKEYDNPNASNTSLVRPSISISKEDEEEAKRASRTVPVGGDASRRSSRLTPPGDSPPPTTRHSRVPSKLSEIAVGTPRHSRIPSNMAPASPTTPTTFITQTNAKGKDDDFADADLMPYDDDGKKPKKRDTFQPPPPISTLQGGYRKSTYSEMSASPTVAGSEYHFGKGKERSSYYPPGRQSSGNSDNHNLMSPSPTETSFQDARQSYYSNPNASVGALPLPNAATMPTMPASAGVPVVVEDFPAIPEEPHTAPARTHQQETQRAAFMAALEEPLAPPRRPRGLGGLTPGGNEGGRMSAYQRLSPTQDSFDPAELNRHSYAAPTPPNGAGMQGGAHRSSYAGGSRRGPFVSNPSPFNPNNSSQSGRGNGMQ